MTDFRLSDDFMSDYIGKQPEFGPLGYIVFKRSYARPVSNENRTEEWSETIRRVVEGTYTVQKEHCKKLKLLWNGVKAQHSAQEMFRLMWEMKFLPPGRGLWSMGTDAIKKKGAVPLYSCAFVTTADLATEHSEPFCFLMDLSMLGCGVGVDTKGAGTFTVKEPRQGDYTFVVEDSREGWVELVRTYVDAYLGRGALPKEIDYSKVRKYGEPIKTFGGVSSGHFPLQELAEQDIPSILDPLVGHSITSQGIVDLFNAIGRCVVSGNVRRAATIALGFPDDKEFLRLKSPENPDNPEMLNKWRWAANNSVFANIGMNYTKVARLTASNGEPGYFWLETAQKYGRLCDPALTKPDEKIVGCNPCQPAWATVLTPKGISTIGDLKKGDTIWSGKQWTKVKDKWSTGTKQVYKYHTRAGTFCGTENHRVVSQGEKIEVCNAKYIDISITPPAQYIPLRVDAIIDGLVIGDGGIHKASNNLVGLYIGENDHDYFKSRYLDDYILKHRPGINKTFYEVDTNIKSYELTKLHVRRIPERYLKSKEIAVVLGFLKGLYSANGSLCEKRVTLKSSSLGLIQDVQLMLSSVGITSSYTVNKARKVKFQNGIYKCKKSYDLNISTGRNKFQKLIGFIQQYKQEKLDKICNTTNVSKYANGQSKISYEIVDKEYVSEEEVFDISVEAEEHTYWTGGLLVSNCSEISMESYEICNVPETFPARHSSLEEYKRTLKFAYLYAKTVTLIPTHNARVNMVQFRNRKIGLSMSGIVQSMSKHGVREHYRWCDKGYKYLRNLDEIYSDWLCIPKSKKITAVKPSGSVSLLPGATSGVHFPYGEYYWRTVRFDSGSELLEALRKAGYRIEQGETKTTSVVYFPVKEKDFTRARKDVSMWEQLEIVAQMQYWWADNQVSCTITSKEEEAADIPRALEFYETRLKSVSFLPLQITKPGKKSKYKHLPLQPMTKKEYESEIKKLKQIELKKITETEGFKHKFCDTDTCIATS